MPVRGHLSRKTIAIASAIVLLTVLFIGAAPMSPYTEKAEAQYLVSGNGYFKNQINWAEWPSGAATVRGGTDAQRKLTSVNTTPIGSDSLVTTCEATQTTQLLTAGANDYATSPIRAVTPGPWSALARAYWQGGRGAANTSVYGLATPNGTNGNKVTSTFDFNCASKIVKSGGGEVIVPLKGIVVADAESSLTLNNNGTNVVTESIKVTPKPNASWANYTWRLLERIRSTGCTNNVVLNRTSANELTLQNSGINSSGAECGAVGSGETQGFGPASVAFLQAPTTGVNRIEGRVSMVGYGTTAMSLGVVLDVDFGDVPTQGNLTNSGIPASYGTAGALFQPTWTGGVIPQGVTQAYPYGNGNSTVDYPTTKGVDLAAAPPVNAPHAPLAELSVSGAIPLLGTTITGDGDYHSSLDAKGDETGDDAFGANQPNIPVIAPNGSHTVNIICTGAGASVAGWVDWNLDGTFNDPAERATATCSVSGTATLTWTGINVNYASDFEAFYMRLRIANAGTTLVPTGVTTSGEVEDYQILRQRPALSLDKAQTPQTQILMTGTRVDYTLTLKNVGNAPFTSTTPATIKDALGDVLQQADMNSTNQVQVTATKNGVPFGVVSYDSSAKVINWTSGLQQMDPGEVVSIKYSITLKDHGTLGPSFKNVAWVVNHLVPTIPTTTFSGQHVPTACLANGTLLGDSSQQICDVTELNRAAIVASKALRTQSSGSGTALPNESQITGTDYYYWLKFENPSTQMLPLNYIDDLTGVEDDLEYSSLERRLGMVGSTALSTCPTSSSATNQCATVVKTGSTLTITGTLGPGRAVYVGYRVRGAQQGGTRSWNPNGDSTLVNALGPANTDCSATPQACITTTHYRFAPSTIAIQKEIVENDGTALRTPLTANELAGWEFELFGDASTSLDVSQTSRQVTPESGSVTWTVTHARGTTASVSVTRAFWIAEQNLRSDYELGSISCVGTGSGQSAAPFTPTSAPGRTIRSGDAINCVVTNKRPEQLGSVSWNKVDAQDTNTTLGGSQWTLSRADGQPFDMGDSTAITSAVITDCVSQTCTTSPDTLTDSNPAAGQFTVPNLPRGTYVLAEQVAPIGYVLGPSTGVQFEIGADNSSTSLDIDLAAISNNRALGKIQWNKVDADEPATLLSGSRWEITLPNGSTKVVIEDCVREPENTTPCGLEQQLHDANPAPGSFTLAGLAWGTYQIREVAAPVGYLLPQDADPIAVTIQSTNLEVALPDVENQRQHGLVVPLTGGIGSDLFKIIGPILLALAAITALIRWRRGHLAT